MSAGSPVPVVPLPFAALSAVEALAARSFDTRWERTSFAYFLASPSARNRAVYGEDGTLEAYCLTLFAAGNLDVVSIAVEPSARRRGLGRAMVDELRAAPDVVSATLEVRKDNEPALRFYERLGFAVVGTRRKYYDGKVDATVMRWDKRRS